MLGIRFELLAQPADMDIDRPRVAVAVAAPDAVQQLAPGERAAGVTREEVQKSELLGTQVHRAAVPSQLSRVEVEIDTVRDPKPVGVARRTCLVGHDGQPAAELVRIEIKRQGRIEAEPQRIQSLGDPIGIVEERDTQARPPTALRRDEIDIRGTSRRHAKDDDPGSISQQHGPKSFRLARDAQQRRGRRFLEPGDAWSLGEDEPLRPMGR